MDEPTVGVDIGTKVEIMKLVRAIAAEGKSVILISSELPELAWGLRSNSRDKKRTRLLKN